MEGTSTNLRQSDNQIKIVGILSEKAIEETTTEDGKEVLRGTIVVKTGSTNTVTVRFFHTKNTKNGGENPAYRSCKAILGYNSIADVGEENATRIMVRGDYSPTSYIDRNGQVREGVPQYRGSFVSSLTPEAVEREGGFQANLSVEAFIKSFEEESKNINGEVKETGRYRCHVWINLYGGLEKSTFIIPEEFAEAFANSVSPGQTRNIIADIVNTAEQVVREIPVEFGKPKKEIYTNYRNELVVTGMSSDYATSDNEALRPKAFDEDTVRQAGVVYSEKIEEMKRQAEAGEVQKAKKPANRQLGW